MTKTENEVLLENQLNYYLVNKAIVETLDIPDRKKIKEKIEHRGYLLLEELTKKYSKNSVYYNSDFIYEEILMDMVSEFLKGNFFRNLLKSDNKLAYLRKTIRNKINYLIKKEEKNQVSFNISEVLEKTLSKGYNFHNTEEEFWELMLILLQKLREKYERKNKLKKYYIFRYYIGCLLRKGVFVNEIYEKLETRYCEKEQNIKNYINRAKKQINKIIRSDKKLEKKFEDIKENLLY
ncbi:MAG: hypothetical protein KatS3mg129_1237 [Leptospiraceae bacterium]|nr:MAG: hypothetical protein KatS3mg129_1237 [Leptospiraceae bacterium]